MNKIKTKRILSEILSPIAYKFWLNRYNKISFLFKNKDILKRNINISNIKKRKRAFILATGPSINSLDLKMLENEDCYSVSNFFLHKDIKVINPSMHFFAPYHEPLILKEYVEWLNNADKKLPKNTKIVLGYKTKEIVNEFNLFNNRDVFYLYLAKGYVKPQIDSLERPILPPQTGPLMIIPVLMYMGYKEIYLVGCDHNILKNYGKDRCNFYNKDEDIRSNATDSKSWPKIIDELTANLNTFKQYEDYCKLAKKNNIKIYNTSKESWLDSFDYIDFNTLFKN